MSILDINSVNHCKVKISETCEKREMIYRSRHFRGRFLSVWPPGSRFRNRTVGAPESGLVQRQPH